MRGGGGIGNDLPLKISVPTSQNFTAACFQALVKSLAGTFKNALLEFKPKFVPA